MIGSAIFESYRSGQLTNAWKSNLLAGITVGVVALPLSMALAIAVGLPPQHGIYTAIVGGVIISLLGGSPVNISGPTAAFVVILAPIVEQYGLGGLLVSGLLAGVILVAFGLLRVGQFIQVMPYPVIIGFTAGIGTVIALLQIQDLLGLTLATSDPALFKRLAAYWSSFDTVQWQEATIGFSTLAVIILWKRVPIRIPVYLIALVWGTALGAVFNYLPLPDVQTIASRFVYSMGEVTGSGVPPMPPTFMLPWNMAGVDGAPVEISLSLVQSLFGAAFAIAILGALESLLCAVVADGMTGKRHNPDSELIGQGIGNIIVPFFGGIPATAAIARTALNVRSGGSTPVSAVVHSLFLLAALLLLAPLLSHIPMAAMAAILVAVAWNMSEVGHVIHLLRTAPKADISVFLVCYGLTVAVDMQVAVAAGMVMAAAMFVRRMSELTNSTLIAEPDRHAELSGRQGVMVYNVEGPLFFGAAHKALSIVASVDHSVKSIVLDISGVTMIDTTGMVNIRSLAESLRHRDAKLYLLMPSERIRKKLQRFGLGDNTDLMVIAESPSVIC